MKQRRSKRRRRSNPIGLNVAILAFVVIIAVLVLSHCFRAGSSRSASAKASSLSLPSAPASSSEAASSEVSSSEAASSETAVSSSSPASRAPSAVSSKTAPTSVAAASTNLLVLVNKEHPLSESFKPDLVEISKKLYTNSGKDNRFNAVAAPYLTKMIAAAAKDGVALRIVSGYRTYAYQKYNYTKQVNAYLSSGYSSKSAVSAALTSVAYPGTSEHETGLAADIINPGWYLSHKTLTAAFENTQAGKWLAAHASEYGFILRYPKGKESVTGYEYEPWHFRFVGVENAKKIKSSGLCLEEWLKANPQ